MYNNIYDTTIEKDSKKIIEIILFFMKYLKKVRLYGIILSIYKIKICFYYLEGLYKYI